MKPKWITHQIKRDITGQMPTGFGKPFLSKPQCAKNSRCVLKNLCVLKGYCALKSAKSTSRGFIVFALLRSARLTNDPLDDLP
ncbi:hypothetical protein C4K31_3112 [Pseudomonas chlororaphis subsp. piscium]|nr:hypothetical protein C4K31_3112 [Pseudomonas chlororaphis subsp. piscium]AZD48539.1 hypothetical protein C4K20_3124 [Pseudomonas chlororaphis subsp. aurantiaca]